MSRNPASKRTRLKPRAVLRLPDLDQAKSAAFSVRFAVCTSIRSRHAFSVIRVMARENPLRRSPQYPRL
jgi:hypothetical protein